MSSALVTTTTFWSSVTRAERHDVLHGSLVAHTLYSQHLYYGSRLCIYWPPIQISLNIFKSILFSCQRDRSYDAPSYCNNVNVRDFVGFSLDGCKIDLLR